MAYTFPSETYGQDGYFVYIDAALVPIVADRLAIMCERRLWDTDASYEQGYNAFAHLRGCMLSCPARELLEAHNRIYRLLDAAMYGRIYEVTDSDPLTIEPAIPDVPNLTAVNPGLVARLALVEKLLDNMFNGTAYVEFSNTRSLRDQLDELIAAIENGGELDDDILAKLVEIGVLLA